MIAEFQRTITPKTSKIASEDLIVCDTDSAPSGFTQGPNAKTRVLCTLQVDLGQVPTRYWKKCANSKRERYLKLDYELGMHIKSGGIHFDLRVDDVAYGNVVAKFE